MSRRNDGAKLTRGPWVEGKEPPEVIARPKCPQCSKTLRPVIHSKTRYVTEDQVFRIIEDSREWTGRYHGYLAFCSTPCCIRFANAAYRAGYRRVQIKEPS